MHLRSTSAPRALNCSENFKAFLPSLACVHPSKDRTVEMADFRMSDPGSGVMVGKSSKKTVLMADR